jgi:broad specificity phosphatase PhoE
LTVAFLIRHGSVVGAETRRFIGHLDVPLSPMGEAQCARLAARLSTAGLSALYTSDLARARRTAEIIGRVTGLAPRSVPSLREMAMGRWDGLTAAEIDALDPVGFAEWLSRIAELPFPDGESVRDLSDRVWPAFEAIVDAHPGGRVAVVAHGGTNRAILCRALGVSLDRLLAFGQDYAAVTVLERAAGCWVLRRLNESSSAP